MLDFYGGAFILVVLPTTLRSIGDGWLSKPEVEQMLKEALADSNGEAGTPERLPAMPLIWLAVKEFNLQYHMMDI